jgi:pilus assembly protein Flp/PilA
MIFSQFLRHCCIAATICAMHIKLLATVLFYTPICPMRLHPIGPGKLRLHTRRLNMTFFKKLIRDEAGATAIEYGLIAALIAIAAMAAMQGLGSQLKASFGVSSSAMAAGNAAGNVVLAA